MLGHLITWKNHRRRVPAIHSTVLFPVWLHMFSGNYIYVGYFHHKKILGLVRGLHVLLLHLRPFCRFSTDFKENRPLNYLAVKGWITFCLQTCLNSLWDTKVLETILKDFWKRQHHIDLLAAHLQYMMRFSRSITSQRCSRGLRSDVCGGHRSTVDSLSCSRNQYEMI